MIGAIPKMTAFVQEIHLVIKSEDRKLIEDVRTAAYGDFDALIRAGVFSFKSGVAEIHRDTNGKIGAIFIREKRL